MTIEELAETVGVPTRTIRYYITEGLLPGPEGRGKATIYGEKHLLRLRLIRRLSEQRMPLTEIREYLGRLSDDDVRVVLAEQDQSLAGEQRTAQALAPRDYISALLKRAREASREYVPGTPARPEPMTVDTSAIYPEPREAPEPHSRYAQPAEDSGPTAFSSEPQAGPRMPAEGTWYCWVIVPGVELHIRSDLVKRYRHLIDILRRAAGETDV